MSGVLVIDPDSRLSTAEIEILLGDAAKDAFPHLQFGTALSPSGVISGVYPSCEKGNVQTLGDVLIEAGSKSCGTMHPRCMEPTFVIPLARDFCAGVRALHSAGFAHLNISDTTLVVSKGRGVVTDYSLAVAVPKHAGVNFSLWERFFSNPDAADPETFCSTHLNFGDGTEKHFYEYGLASDIWSLGYCLLLFFSGQQTLYTEACLSAVGTNRVHALSQHVEDDNTLRRIIAKECVAEQANHLFSGTERFTFILGKIGGGLCGNFCPILLNNLSTLVGDMLNPEAYNRPDSSDVLRRMTEIMHQIVSTPNIPPGVATDVRAATMLQSGAFKRGHSRGISSSGGIFNVEFSDQSDSVLIAAMHKFTHGPTRHLPAEAAFVAFDLCYRVLACLASESREIMEYFATVSLHIAAGLYDLPPSFPAFEGEEFMLVEKDGKALRDQVAMLILAHAAQNPEFGNLRRASYFYDVVCDLGFRVSQSLLTAHDQWYAGFQQMSSNEVRDTFVVQTIQFFWRFMTENKEFRRYYLLLDTPLFVAKHWGALISVCRSVELVSRKRANKPELLLPILIDDIAD